MLSDGGEALYLETEKCMESQLYPHSSWGPWTFRNATSSVEQKQEQMVKRDVSEGHCVKEPVLCRAVSEILS